MIKLKSNKTKAYADKLIKVGANVYSELPFEGSIYKEIICVEPLMYNEMLESIKNFKGKCKTYPVKAAITDTDNQELDFHVYHNRDGEGRGQSSSVFLKKSQPAKTIKIQTRTLSSLIEEHGWAGDSFDLILDCEGAELMSLQSLGTYINNAQKMQIETFSEPTAAHPWEGSSESKIDSFLESDFNKVAERRNEGVFLADTVYLRKGLTFFDI